VTKKKREPPVYYWDTCVFIALLTKEQRPFGEMQGVMSVGDANIREENKIITSAITRLRYLRI